MMDRIVRDKRRHVWTGILLLMICLLTGCGAEGMAETTAAAQPGNGGGQETTVHFIDVGQGDSILIESAGHAMLVDAGENNQAEAVEAYLRRMNVKKLDYVIGTHPHSDHIGGLDVVIRDFEVEKVIMPPVEHTTKTFEDVLDAVADKGLKITKPVAGDTYELGAASFEIIAPNRGDYGDDLNNWSVGIRLTQGERSFVMAGDAEAGAEADICANGLELSADVLKLGHHGSSTSTSEEFLKAVNPSSAVISCGKDNDYGHPHRETMDLMEKYGITVYRTDQMGTVTVTTDGKKLTWKTERQGETAKNDETASEAESGQAKAAAEAEDTYVVNSNTKVFHRPDCSSVGKMKPENRETVTSGREDLIGQGYSPCGSCKP